MHACSLVTMCSIPVVTKSDKVNSTCAIITLDKKHVTIAIYLEFIIKLCSVSIQHDASTILLTH